MSVDELTNWMAFAREEPFGDTRADYRNALLCATIANVQGVKRKPSDFMPFTKAHQEPQTKSKRGANPVAESLFAAIGTATKRLKVIYVTAER